MSYELDEARKLVLNAGLELVERGLIARTWGNISARISDKQFVITPSGRSYDSLIPEDIVIVNIKDCSYEGEIKPSGEVSTHAEVYRQNPDANFVIHTHQNYASAISVMGTDITDLESYNEVLKDNGRNYVEILGSCVPCAKYAISASTALAAKVKASLKKNPGAKALLLRHHGVVCIGQSYEEAFLVSTALEEVCQSKYEFLTQSFMAEAAKDVQKDYGSSYREDNVIHLTLGDKTASWPAGYLKNTSRSDVPGALKGVAMLHDAIYQDININCVEHVTGDFTNIISLLGKSVKPYIDDQTQIIGVKLPCIKIRIKLHKLRNGKRMVKRFRDSNAILLKTGGALCTGANKDDIEAAAMVLEKGCMAAVLAHLMPVIKPVPRRDAKKMREIYKTSYSKLKEYGLTAATLNEIRVTPDRPAPASIFPPVIETHETDSMEPSPAIEVADEVAIVASTGVDNVADVSAAADEVAVVASETAVDEVAIVASETAAVVSETAAVASETAASAPISE